MGKCVNNGCVKTIDGNCVQCLDGLRLFANGCVTPTAYTCQSCGVGFVFVNGNCTPSILGCEKYDTNNLCAICIKPFQLSSKGMC